MSLKKRNLLIFLIIVVLFIISIFTLKIPVTTQKWNWLNYDITLNLDGSMDVIETGNIEDSEDIKAYKSYYTIPNAITVYDDCAELCWQFLEDTNTIPGKNITGTIHLPKGLKNTEEINVWMHGNFNGKIEKVSEDMIKFSVPTLNTQTMLEIRVLTEGNIYEECTNISHISKLNTTIQEEQELINNNKSIFNVFIIIMIIINLIIIIILIFSIKKRLAERKKYGDSKHFSKYNIKYFKNIPDEENATPVRANFMLKYRNKRMYEEVYSNDYKMFTATLLDMALKGAIEFEFVNEKDIKIILNKQPENLPEEQKIIYELFKKIFIETQNNSSILISELKKYSRKHSKTFMEYINRIKISTENYEKDNGKLNNDKEKMKILENTNCTVSLYYIFIIVSLLCVVVLPALTISLIIYLFFLLKNLKEISPFTESGYKEQKEWYALKKYMRDYSSIKEKNVPDVKLWEKYLVYATLFGNYKKTLKTLKVLYPELFNSNSKYFESDLKAMNALCSGFGRKDGLDILNNSLRKMYKATINAYMYELTRTPATG